MSKRKNKNKKKPGQWSGKPCPACRDKRTVKLTKSGHWLRCCSCGVTFDDEPDEGGDYFTDPTKRMMREEEREKRNRRTHG